MRVLVTGTEHAGGLAALRALRSAGYDPVAAVASAGDLGARSRAAAGTIEAPDARVDPEGFADAIAAGAAGASAAAVLPGTDPALVALAAHADRFPDEVALGVPSPTTALTATDKVGTLALAADAGVRTLSARVLGAEGPPDPDSVRFPVVVKPLRSEGPAPRRADDLEELVLAIAAMPDGIGIVQAHVDGPLVGVSGVAWEGEVVAEVHERTLRRRPAELGRVAQAETIEADRELGEQARALIAELGWSGVFNLQFAGPFLVDVNPRLYASIGLAVAAGANLPAIWVETLLGRRPEVEPYRVGVRFRTAYSIASLSDPRPALAYLRRLPGRLLPTGGVLTRAPGV